MRFRISSPAATIPTPCWGLEGELRDLKPHLADRAGEMRGMSGESLGSTEHRLPQLEDREVHGNDQAADQCSQDYHDQRL